MKRILYFFLFTALVSSCTEDSELKPLDHVPNTNPNPPLMKVVEDIAPAAWDAQIYNEKGGFVQGPKGTWFEFPAYTYGSVQGAISLKIYEIYNKKNMVGAGVYTETEDGRMLNSYGMFKVVAYRNGAVIQPTQDVTVTMPLPAGSTPADTKIFELIESFDSVKGRMRGLWRETTETWTTDTMSPGRLKFNIRLIKWINLDKYMAAGSNNRIRISVPEGFTNRNTDVYFNLDNVNGLTLLSADPVNKQFYTPELMSGLSGTIVLASLKDNIYYKKILKITFTGQEQVITLDRLDPSNSGELFNILSGM